MSVSLYPDVGLTSILQTLLIAAENGNAQLRLYKAAHVPTGADVLATYTAIECGYPGYAEQTLDGYPPVTVAANVASATWATVTFTSTGVGTDQAFGWFLTLGSTILYAAGQFPLPVGMYAAGDWLSLTLTQTLQNAA